MQKLGAQFIRYTNCQQAINFRFAQPDTHYNSNVVALSRKEPLIDCTSKSSIHMLLAVPDFFSQNHAQNYSRC